MIRVTRTSPITNKINTISIPLTQEEYEISIKAWQDGMFIQDAFPTLRADEREFIMTGITSNEWDKMFKNMGI